MSLVGNLEDLSLGDLLQIVSLSQKTGVLALDSPSGAGQIVFHRGLVRAAGIKGRTPDLRALCVRDGLADGLADGERVDAAIAGLRPPVPLSPERLAEALGLELDRLEASIRRSAEAAIYEMFAWATGEFSFDARKEGEDDGLFPGLRVGINAQYLAMEGMRLRDEDARGASASDAETPEIDLSEEMFFGTEPLEVDGEGEGELELETSPLIEDPPARASVAPRAPAEPSIARVAAPEAAPAPMPAPSPEAADAADIVAARAVARVDALPASPPDRPLVVIDPDAAVLEWLKAAIGGRYPRIHVFQRADQGLARIRQYLIRGEVPLVVVSPATAVDPLSGIHGLPDFVKRLRAQAPRIVVAGLREEVEGRTDPVPGFLDGMLLRPPRTQMGPAVSADLATRGEALARALAEIVTNRDAGVSAARTTAKTRPPAAGRGGRSPAEGR